jgi:hypothetical protein
VPDEHAEGRIARNLLRHAASLFHLLERTGRAIELSLEPEPCCHLETVSETLSFFDRRLLSADGLAELARYTGLTPAKSEEVIRRHLSVCLDACHLAVEFEDAADALRAVSTAGVRIGKIQVTAGLEVHLAGSPNIDRKTLEGLGRFADATYLHQVVENKNGALRRYVDLPDAFASFERAPGPAIWRVHFHVPIFQEDFGLFRSTQPFVKDLLHLTATDPISEHLEVETYTWDVLPPEHRHSSVVDAIAGELAWALKRLS